ncbi:MAG: hypothetical protein ACK4WB_00660 [Desulfatiglandales bacterium]
MSYKETLLEKFPNVILEREFVRRTYNLLKELGFRDENTIACVCCCRDEISQTLPVLVRDVWGEAFNLAGLAGLFSAGRTGLNACLHHAPHHEGKERYVFYVAPHIGIDRRGNWGSVKRKGQNFDSSSCGALWGFWTEIKEGKIKTAIDERDLEMCYLRIRLLRKLRFNHVPDLLELTLAAHEVTLEDIEDDLQRLIDSKRSDYALFSGIQINAPDTNYLVPLKAYALVDGRKKELSFV